MNKIYPTKNSAKAEPVYQIKDDDDDDDCPVEDTHTENLLRNLVNMESRVQQLNYLLETKMDYFFGEIFKEDSECDPCRKPYGMLERLDSVVANIENHLDVIAEKVRKISGV